MSEVGVRAAAILAEHAVASMRPGLTDEEFQAIESRYQLRFGDDHRAFLAAGLPTGGGWPDWRSGDEMVLRQHIGRPARELLGAGTPDPKFVANSPRVIPVYGPAFVSQGPDAPGSAVWAVQEGEVTLLGPDLEAFVRYLCGLPTEPVDVAPPAPFTPPEPEPQLTVAELGAPPFQPDWVTTVPQTVAPAADAAAALTALGVPLGPATRHEEALADGGALWSVPVEPGLPALELWAAVRARFPQTGLWPLLVTEATWHRIGPDDSPSPVFAELDSRAWLMRRYERSGGSERLARDAISLESPGDCDWRDDWVGFRPEPHDRLALVPAWADWLVPGLLGWTGAVNYDVRGVEHATMLRRWSGHWGAELLALDDEFMTLRVQRPPTVQAARTCALEAYLYCPDAVEQGFNSVDELGRMMVRPLWTLWWD